MRQADLAWTFNTLPSFPHAAHTVAADVERIATYSRALRRVLRDTAARKAATGGGNMQPRPQQLSVLDVGAGSGVLSLIAARIACEEAARAASTEPQHGVSAHNLSQDQAHAAGDGSTPSNSHAGGDGVTVIAAELVAPLATVARRNVALNGASDIVSVACADAAAVERGGLVPWDGVDVIVCDLFDAGLVGHQVLPMLEAVKAKLLAHGGRVVPERACLYAMGIELTIPAVALPAGPEDIGLQHAPDLSALQRYWCAHSLG